MRDYRQRFLSDHPKWFALQRDGTRGKYMASLPVAADAFRRHGD